MVVLLVTPAAAQLDTATVVATVKDGSGGARSPKAGA